MPAPAESLFWTSWNLCPYMVNVYTKFSSTPADPPASVARFSAALSNCEIRAYACFCRLRVKPSRCQPTHDLLVQGQHDQWSEIPIWESGPSMQCQLCFASGESSHQSIALNVTAIADGPRHVSFLLGFVKPGGALLVVLFAKSGTGVSQNLLLGRCHATATHRANHDKVQSRMTAMSVPKLSFA